MTNQSIQQVSPISGALSAEHYESYEMAKANDDVIGGENLAQLRSYSAASRAHAQAVHKTIAMMQTFNGVAAAKAEAVESSQAWAKVGIYADERMGEIISSLPTKQGARTDATLSSAQDEVTKTEAIREAGITRSQAYDLVKMAANPDVVEAVIAKAEAEGRIVSRSQVLKAIAERDEAKRECDRARHAERMMQREVKSLQAKVTEKPEPEVIEREVVREVESQESRRRIAELERENKRLNDEYQQMWKKKRDVDQRLQQANELLGENDRNNNARRDIEQLTIATNSYLRNYGGKAWAFDQFDRVDEPTQQEFIKAITSLAAFAQNMAAMVSERKQENI